MFPITHPGRLLKREIEARAVSANRLALDLQGQYAIAVVEAERGEDIARRVKPADAP